MRARGINRSKTRVFKVDREKEAESVSDIFGRVKRALALLPAGMTIHVWGRESDVRKYAIFV